MKKILISLCLLSIFITGCSDSNENNEHTSGIVSDSQSITENEVTETETDVTEKNETDETISTIDVEAVYAEAYNEAIKQRELVTSFEELVICWFDYVNCYNNIRIHAGLNYETPSSYNANSF